MWPGSVGVVRARVGALTTSGPAGRVAAQNMLAQEAEISTVPYLWTAMFGRSLRYAGNGGPGRGRGRGVAKIGGGAMDAQVTGWGRGRRSPAPGSRDRRPPARPAGYGEGFDDVIIQGDLEELKFVAFYTK